MDFDNILGSCYDKSFGTDNTILAASGSILRQKRNFDELVEDEARQMNNDIENIIGLFAAKNSYWSEKILEELIESRKIMMDLKTNLNATVLGSQFREYFLSDIILYQRDYWYNETNMSNLSFKEWVWNQTPIGGLFSIAATVLTLIFKFSDDRIASLIAKAKQMTLKGWQKVINVFIFYY